MLEFLDWIIIAAYFIIVFLVAFWSSFRKKRKSKDSSDYFLAGRNVGWFIIGASLFASNIGGEHLVGLAGTGAASGVAVGQFEILASLKSLILAWLCSFLFKEWCFYNARIFREKIFFRCTMVSCHYFYCWICSHKNLCNNCSRWNCFLNH